MEIVRLAKRRERFILQIPSLRRRDEAWKVFRDFVHSTQMLNDVFRVRRRELNISVDQRLEGRVDLVSNSLSSEGPSNLQSRPRAEERVQHSIAETRKHPDQPIR